MRSIRNFRAETAESTTPAALLPDISLAGAPMALLDRNGAICEVNREFSALTGFSEAELQGAALGLILKNARYAGGAPSRGKSSLSVKSGRALPVFYAILPSPGASFSVLTAISLEEEERLKAELAAKAAELEKREEYIECFREGVFRMITDLDRSETELKRTLKNLRETQVQLVQSSKMKALGELAASLVHEISQPLTVIRGLTHGMLRAMEEDSKWRDKMRLIGDAASRMEKIVKHLKSFSRAEPPVFSPVDLNSVVKDSFLILNEHLLSHSIETLLDLAPVPFAMGNPNRLEQVVINLVTNAREAMPDGGVITVSTRADTVGGRSFVRLMVKDSGVGIPEEVIDRVFDPFFTTKETGKGTGLGLSISLSIVREHKGEIRVESLKGQGTTFHVLLPAISAG